MEQVHREHPLVRFLWRASAWATIVAAVATVALGVSSGRATDLVVVPIMAAALAFLITWLAPAGERLALGRILALALAVRCLASAAIYSRQLSIGQGGFLTGDDFLYWRVAYGYAQWLHGTPFADMVPPSWGGGAYAFGIYTYLTAAIYYVMGQRVLLVVFVNGAAAVAGIAFTWDIARRMFGMRPAFVVAAILSLSPLAILFSSINIKDPLGLLFATLTMWCLVRFAFEPRWRWFAAAGLAIELTLGVRTTAGLAAVGALLVTIIALKAPRRIARSWTVAGVVLAAGLFAVGAQTANIPFSQSVLAQLEQVRSGMSGGRTGFVPTTSGARPATFGAPLSASEAAILPTESADILAGPAVIGPPATFNDTPVVTILIRVTQLIVFVVAARLLWAVSIRWPRTAQAILGGSVVAMGLFVIATVVTFVSSPGGISSTVRTVTYVPYGLAHVLFAPFPWAVRSAIDVVSVPQTLVWYVLLAGASYTLVTYRGTRRVTLPIGVYVAAMLAAFVVSEGNVGTLVRHRTMTIDPMVALLAAPALVAAWDAIAVRLDRRRAEADGLGDLGSVGSPAV